MFDPKAHLIQLPRRVKDTQTGQWNTRQDDYLEVKWRLVWFREQFPHGSIITETVLLDWDKGVCIHRAHVGDGEGDMATGTGTETHKSFEDFVEKSETRAIGRALAALGIGTQFVGEELSEGEHVADAPVSPSMNGDITTHDVVTKAQDQTTIVHPTADEITTLIDTARAANVSLEDFGHDMRRLMNIDNGAKVTKKFLRERMTMAQYELARKEHGEKLRVILEEDVLNHEPPSQAVDADASAHVPETMPETMPAVPSNESSSAPENGREDAAERDRQRLRAEVAQWDLKVSAKEIEHVIQHNPYLRARQLLWQASRGYAGAMR